ncbi:genetic suppressor element 1 [Manacus vitellinus]|uniref:genetic suppressor element 1 n=1 Tax=Manacus vitellinus TaxID=328815 RepID=UPI00115DA684|nr:genetic suppressor element 1 [Manacus vitellinus]
MGPIIVPPGGHSVPSTPPVVTIAPTKTVNGVWRSEGRQQEAGSRGSSSSAGRERLISEPPLTQEKAGGPTVPSHLLGTPYSFGLPPSSVVQDSRFPPLNLQRPVHHVVPPSAVTEDYLRSFRPYHTAEDLRMSSLPPLGLDPATAAAYYHPSYLTHHPFPHPAFRMDESYCLSALRSPFYPLPAPGSLPPLHPSAMHLHLSGVRYPPELSHSSLSALQSERISSLAAERLQMDEELRQREREREREREKEREREADREREKEREREREREKELEREREKERERELERQRERAREKELSMVKAMEGPFLPVAELHGLRGHPAEERGKPVEPLAPGRPDKLKDSVLPTPKPIQHPLHPPPGSHHPVPSLIPNHSVFPLPGSSAATALLIHRTNEEEKWLARQRRLRQEKEDRQSQVSEFRQQVLEQHLDMGRVPSQPEPEHRPEHPRSGSSRHEPSSREPGQHFGGPPPLISPKPQHHPVTTSLWNPVSLMENPPDPPRRLPEPHALHGHPAPFEPSRQGIPLVKVERVFCPEKLEEGSRKRDVLEKYPPGREPGAPEHGGFTHTPFLAELEKSTQSILSQQRPPATPFPEATKPSSPYRPPQPRAQDPMYIYDEFVQQHRRLVSKLDLEERRRREAREKGGTAALTAEQNHKLDASIHYNIPELQASTRLAGPPHNGTAEGPLAHRALPPLPRDSASEEEDEEEEEEEEEEDYPRPKWQGIEAIFEAYQEHIEEQNLERQVLQTQCRRLEAQHYSLSLTAEQLSHSMAALRKSMAKHRLEIYGFQGSVWPVLPSEVPSLKYNHRRDPAQPH